MASATHKTTDAAVADKTSAVANGCEKRSMSECEKRSMSECEPSIIERGEVNSEHIMPTMPAMPAQREVKVELTQPLKSEYGEEVAKPVCGENFIHHVRTKIRLPKPDFMVVSSRVIMVLVGALLVLAIVAVSMLVATLTNVNYALDFNASPSSPVVVLTVQEGVNMVQTVTAVPATTVTLHASTRAVVDESTMMMAVAPPVSVAVRGLLKSHNTTAYHTTSTCNFTLTSSMYPRPSEPATSKATHAVSGTASTSSLDTGVPVVTPFSTVNGTFTSIMESAITLNSTSTSKSAVTFTLSNSSSTSVRSSNSGQCSPSPVVTVTLTCETIDYPTTTTAATDAVGTTSDVPDMFSVMPPTSPDAGTSTTKTVTTKTVKTSTRSATITVLSTVTALPHPYGGTGISLLTGTGASGMVTTFTENGTFAVPKPTARTTTVHSGADSNKVKAPTLNHGNSGHATYCIVMLVGFYLVGHI